MWLQNVENILQLMEIIMFSVPCEMLKDYVKTPARLKTAIYNCA